MLPNMTKPEKEDLEPVKEKKLLFTKDEVKALANAYILRVVFDKVDGTERTMKCSLREDILPKPDTSGLVVEQRNRQGSEDNVAVWDLEANGWRSFRLDSLKSIVIYEDQTQ